LEKDKKVKNRMQKLDKEYWIVRSNALNEMRDFNMTVTEVRLFSIFQCKINPENKQICKVEFELSEFERIMELKRANVTVLEQIGKRIVTRTATIRNDNGGFKVMPLFGEFELYKKENGEWWISIDTNPKMIPYMFELKKNYFKYKLWNVLRLKSVNQQRMYEILKQYELAKAREIDLDILKSLLGINQKQYPEWRDFKRDVLDVCQKALSEHTDIKFSYEPIKRGKGGKVVAIKFDIQKNAQYVDQFSLDEYIDLHAMAESDTESKETQCESDQFEEQNELRFTELKLHSEQAQVNNFNNENLEFLSEACNCEFDEKQLDIIKSYLIKLVPFESKTYQNDQYDYLLSKYKELNYRAKRQDLTPLKSRFAYLKSLLEIEVKNIGVEE
jgi:plasmid replication initiation protein